MSEQNNTERRGNNHGECACAACDPPDSERLPTTTAS